MKTTLGGDRLGSGNEQKISMKNYERSTHDLGYIWRSSMSAGTLVPFMSEVGLPGDSFDIDLNADVKTLPTVGPLYGSYKVQMDVFQCPIRLYQGKLHMNMLNIGMDMSEIKLPQLQMKAGWDVRDPLGENQQVNSSAIFSYLNIRGLGRPKNPQQVEVERRFNAVPYLSYWDIYKNYYADKQIEKGVVIHNGVAENDFEVTESETIVDGKRYDTYQNLTNIKILANSVVQQNVTLRWGHVNQTAYGQPNYKNIALAMTFGTTNIPVQGIFDSERLIDISVLQDGTEWRIEYFNYKQGAQTVDVEWVDTKMENTLPAGQNEPSLVEFPLSNIDDMRMDILSKVRQPTAVLIDETSYSPYGLSMGKGSLGNWNKLSSQEGLGCKTYQSDLFNNWVSTEWIDGTNGINEITAVSTTGDEFTIDALNLANKVYNMLNRIAISGGSYDDWLDAVYTHERAKGHENPIYQGSLIKELSFEEVISNADTSINGNTQPLGTLAGRGKLTGKDKGGRIKIKVDEPSYIMGIVSITPRIDYSQGNKWDVNLETMNDLHKPALDEIGFQDLITDQMAWFDTTIGTAANAIEFSSAGKQPAWINYMTNVNQTRGSFAVENDSMYMTLNRRYEGVDTDLGIEDLTTYVDPSKYNNIFAQTSIDSQNFWVQIASKITARRKMSAEVIPNL